MTKEELEKALKEVEDSLSPDAVQVFNIVTEAIMREIAPGSMYSQDILDGIEAVAKVTRLHSNPNLVRGH